MNMFYLQGIFAVETSEKLSFVSYIDRNKGIIIERYRISRSNINACRCSHDLKFGMWN